MHRWVASGIKARTRPSKRSRRSMKRPTRLRWSGYLIPRRNTIRGAWRARPIRPRTPSQILKEFDRSVAASLEYRERRRRSLLRAWLPVPDNATRQSLFAFDWIRARLEFLVFVGGIRPRRTTDAECRRAPLLHHARRPSLSGGCRAREMVLVPE